MHTWKDFLNSKYNSKWEWIQGDSNRPCLPLTLLDKSDHVKTVGNDRLDEIDPGTGRPMLQIQHVTGEILHGTVETHANDLVAIAGIEMMKEVAIPNAKGRGTEATAEIGHRARKESLRQIARGARQQSMLPTQRKHFKHHQRHL